MAHIGADETVLFRGRGVEFRLESVGFALVVVVVAPFGEVIGEFEAGEVGVGVFEVNYYEPLVGVGREEKGGLAARRQAEDVAVLSLRNVLVQFISRPLIMSCLTSLWANTSLSLIALGPP